MPQASNKNDAVLATYTFSIPADVDPLEKVRAFAIGQTIGTWVDVPGLTQEMVDNYQGEVVDIKTLDPSDLVTEGGNTTTYTATLSLPAVSIGADIPRLFTSLLGNDASTSMAAKLVDVQLPASMTSKLPGPKHGVAGIRKLLGIPSRPLLLNMIKPCTGLTPAQGSEIFRETALGGPDLIKDDELMGDPEFSPIDQRVTAYNKAAQQAFEETGHRTIYVPNITAQGTALFENAKRAINAGARALMVCYAAVGYGSVVELREKFDVPILGHYASANTYYENASSGMSAALALGFFPRLVGADMAVINTPYSGYPMRKAAYLATARKMLTPMSNLQPSFPVVGGGVKPGVVYRYLEDLGTDIVLASGGAIQGHPQGPAAGVRAMRQAIDAYMDGVTLEEAAREHSELATALDVFGVVK
ncbi:RuBisCO large subunit C-terminal-like domain-containing protein [Varibaculum prostatecancerukia]|uniref:RuBisCO large subunit C-terminal-like domain-containing protein n=1 Tax=Varibaculum prostatecancerukia TaxID=2811781 RepID=UPI001C00267C|nr:RuBisCO large subunit C-terminal-like domain-containing protein [Varibaculum prostatecancerukia]